MKKTEIAQSIAAVSDRTVQRALYNLFEAITGDDPADGVKEGVFGSGLPFQSLVQTGIPVGLPSSGIITASGQLTLDTAFPTTYAGGIWLRFPPGAVSGDTTGGLYWCVMTSPTQGTVYAPRVDTSQGFVPYLGNINTSVNGSNSSYAQTTNVDIVIARFTLPANSMGPYGRMRFNTAFGSPSNTNQKVFGWAVGSSLLSLWSQTFTSATFSGGFPLEIRARGTNRLISSNWGHVVFHSSNPLSYQIIDLTIPQDIIAIARLTAATDYFVLEGFGAEVLYADR